MRRLLERAALVVIALFVVGALAWEARVDRASAGDNELRVAIDALRAGAGSVDALPLSARLCTKFSCTSAPKPGPKPLRTPASALNWAPGR